MNVRMWPERNDAFPMGRVRKSLGIRHRIGSRVQSPQWYIVMAGIIIACLTIPSVAVREFALPVAWGWPILIWSAIGNREIHNNVQQLAFSSASPLLRQLPAQWLAGFIVTMIRLACWHCFQAPFSSHLWHWHPESGAEPASSLRSCICSSGISVP